MYLLVPRQFLAKIAIFCQNSTFTQSNNESCVRDFFSSVFSFGKIKGYYYCKNKFYRLCQIDCKLENSIDVTISDMNTIIKFFWRCFVSLVKFSYWSKFHVNMITGSGVMTVSFYKGLTRNLEIGNTPVRVLPNIWRLGQAKNTKFGTNVSNKRLLNFKRLKTISFNGELWRNSVIGFEMLSMNRFSASPDGIINFFFFQNTILS